MQDAFNLGWKLAAVIRGDAPEDLLDTYHSERHAVDDETLRIIRAQAVVSEPGQRSDDLYDVFKRLIGIPEVNDYLATLQSGFAIR
jgi:2-polyprenyl-6-methoxyphenol hydroxylase-like FAD-dependent oxidoreductase